MTSLLLKQKCPQGHTHIDHDPEKDFLFCFDCNKRYYLEDYKK